jgi:hypothetical protein
MPSIIMTEEGSMQICCLIGGIEAIDPSPVRHDGRVLQCELPTRSNLALAACCFKTTIRNDSLQECTTLIYLISKN